MRYRKKCPDLYKKAQKWREKVGEQYTNIEPTMDNIEGLQTRMKWLKLKLGDPSLKGDPYKKIYHEYMQVSMCLDDIVDKYVKRK